jgi:hypothetical protein
MALCMLLTPPKSELHDLERERRSELSQDARTRGIDALIGAQPIVHRPTVAIREGGTAYVGTKNKTISAVFRTIDARFSSYTRTL